MQITINSETTANYQRETSGGRDYVVTKMRPIEGDSIMNGLLYSMPVVSNSYGQLDKLPAPVGHPVFNGEPVSALDPQGAARRRFISYRAGGRGGDHVTAANLRASIRWALAPVAVPELLAKRHDEDRGRVMM